MRHAVILAGGGGTRLWPASRRARPKQLMTTPSGETLVGMTARRLAGLGELGLVTGESQVVQIREAFVREGHALDEAAVVVEPTGRSTAAALGLAAVHALHRDPDAILGVFPADHFVADVAGFRRVADLAYRQIERADVIATIGIAPERPDTGFGYLDVGALDADGVGPVRRFVEKPDEAGAARLIAAGCLWNAGMFFARARRIIDELGRHLPATGAALARVAAALVEGGRERAAELTLEVYPSLPSISFDHGVMEKTSGVLAVRGSFGWSDVGAWPALAEWGEPDAAGNVALGTAVTVDAARNLVATDAGTVVALVGVSDLVVVRSGDAVLVMPKDRAHEVKEAVAALAAAGLDRFL
jgi:mannose-1-phosphate guanylyltransferase